MTDENNEEKKDAFYYLGKAGARIGPFLLGNPARTLEEMQEVLVSYIAQKGYEKHPQVFVMGQETGGPDLVDVALTTHTIRLIVKDKKIGLEEAVNQFREQYSTSTKLIEAINSAKSIVGNEQADARRGA